MQQNSGDEGKENNENFEELTVEQKAARGILLIAEGKASGEDECFGVYGLKNGEIVRARIDKVQEVHNQMNEEWNAICNDDEREDYFCF